MDIKDFRDVVLLLYGLFMGWVYGGIGQLSKTEKKKLKKKKVKFHFSIIDIGNEKSY